MADQEVSAPKVLFLESGDYLFEEGNSARFAYILLEGNMEIVKNIETPIEEESDDPIIETLPMNSEQREAVNISLNNPLALITGQPGTGKSQVIYNLIINAAHKGKRVLFTSKNNKAVDVVETRVNSLAIRPILLRVGSQGAFQLKLAEYILDLISSKVSETALEDYETCKQNYEEFSIF